MKPTTRRDTMRRRSGEVTAIPHVKIGGLAIGSVALSALALGSVAIGSAAVGALAVGALAVGRLKVGKTNLKEVTIGRLRVDELIIGDRVLTVDALYDRFLSQDQDHARHQARPDDRRTRVAITRLRAARSGMADRPG